MHKTIRVLILTAPFGNGHLSVAKEIQRELETYPNVNVIQYDLYTEEYYYLTKFLRRYHLRQYKKGLSQWSYKYIYYNSGKLLKTRIGRLYERFGRKRLIRKIKEVQPDLILNTFPVNCSYYLKEAGIDLPVFTMITDYYANENWIHPNLTCHFVASENVVDQLLNKGIAEQQVLLTGIPVREPFYQPKSKEEVEAIRKEHRIDPSHKVVLAVAGAKGVLPQFKLMAKRLSTLTDVTLLLVCGNQKKLYRQLAKTFKDKPNVRVFPYVNDMDRLMAISDLMVTKPGGITITECAQMGLPLVLFKPIYGQELENARYFAKREAAVVVHRMDELVQAVQNILSDENRLAMMKKNIADIAQKDSAHRIVQRMLAELGDRDENQENQEVASGLV